MSRGIAVPPFLAMEVAREASRRAAAGEDIVRFDVGQPGFGAPEAALAAVEAALRREPMGYSEAKGIEALRRRIAERYRALHGVALDPDRIVMTTGASGAFLLAFLASFNRGDRVALASPGYPPYRHILHSLGYEAEILPGDPAQGLQLTAASLERAVASREGGIAGALVASPANPTGAMLGVTALRELATVAAARGLTLISDEIYHGLTYETSAISALEVSDDAIVINSFSKFWAMTGWRLGWIVAPAAVAPRLEALAQNLAIAPPTVSQVAALAALESADAEAECLARLDVYRRGRAHLLAEAPGLSLPVVAPPEGAFYMLLDVSTHAPDSFALSRKLLDAGVAVTPGVDFCEAQGRSWVRIAYCRPFDEVERGVERLARALRG